MVKLQSALNGSLVLQGNGLEFGTLKQGESIVVNDTMMQHPDITSCLRMGWLIVGSADATETVVGAPGAIHEVSYISARNSSEVPAAPGITSGVPVASSAEHPGAVPSTEEIMMAAMGRQPHTQWPVAPSADDVIRQSHNQNVTVTPMKPSAPDNTVVNADQLIANTASVADSMNRPKGFTGTPPFMVGQNVPAQAAPAVDQGEMITKARRGRPPKLEKIAPPQPQIPVVPQPAGVPMVQQNQKGHLIISSEIPGQAGMLDIDTLQEQNRVNLTAATNDLIDSVHKATVTSSVTSEYAGWDQNKKLMFIANTSDIATLEAVSMQEKSGVMHMLLRNKIAEIKGIPADSISDSQIGGAK